MFVTLKTFSGRPIRTVLLSDKDKKQRLISRLIAYGFEVKQSKNVLYVDYKNGFLFN